MKLSKESTQPAYLLTKNPRGWFKSALPQVRTTNLELSPKVSIRSGSKSYPRFCLETTKTTPEQLWFEKTGVEACDTRLTIIMPVHNESSFLPSVLGTLALAHIPTSAHVKFLFITNGCTDNGRSATIINNFLQGLGPVETRSIHDGSLPCNFSDRQIDQTFTQTQIGNVQFLHLNTPTAGKPNALNIGNKIAQAHGPIAMCLDANDFPEPDAIANLYKIAHEHFISSRNGVKIVSGESVTEFSGRSIFKGILKEAESAHRELATAEDAAVRGGFYAWDTRFVEKIGGVPPTANESYALGVIARLNGAKISRQIDARSWKYRPNTLPDILSFGARLVRGTVQLANACPEAEEFLKNDAYYMRSLTQRIETIISKSKQQPKKSAYYLASFMAWEIMRWQGHREYRKNPKTQTWDPILSTKS